MFDAPYPRTPPSSLPYNDASTYIKKLKADPEEWVGKEAFIKYLEGEIYAACEDLRRPRPLKTGAQSWTPTNSLCVVDISHARSARQETLIEKRWHSQPHGESPFDVIKRERDAWLREDIEQLQTAPLDVVEQLVMVSHRGGPAGPTPISGYTIELFASVFDIAASAFK